MTIDLNSLIRRKRESLKVELTLDASEVFGGNSEIRASKPILVEGNISLVGDIIIMDVKVVTELLLNCSRCIESFQYPIDITVHEEFTNISDNRDDNVIFIDSDNIDITEIIENNIILALPIKKLCSENCNGLCQTCGTNLNVDKCICGNEVIDPRLAKLKDLFLTD